ncbi:hypothetical protein [Rhodococcus sp. 14-2483-1-2]|uniref:hypothetical protein n=1 Tax=Rhodococcus sp. 14-2483-1-2 TaxID=2023147 RepID=UPI00113FF624|nr:hypothetical protein [Rhodococcus sp. 14-2483-1-2]
MVDANLVEARNHWIRSASYIHMNPTEKGMVSFFLGQLQAKLFAEEVLGIDYFAHYESYLLASGQSMSKSRPDFIGFDRRGRVFVNVEAKGRFGASLSGTEKARAKDQVRTMRIGSPATVEHSYVHVGHFPNGSWVAELHDPPPVSPEMMLDPSLGSFLHYWPLVSAIADREQGEFRSGGLQSSTSGDTRYVFREFPEVGIAMGLPARIYDAVLTTGQRWMKSHPEVLTTDGLLALAEAPAGDINDVPARYQNREISYGRDKTICVLIP